MNIWKLLVHWVMRCSHYWYISLCKKQNKTRKTTFVNIYSDLLRRLLKLPSSWWSIEVFQKFFFPLKAQILPLVTNTVSCLPESNRLLSFTFKHAWIALFVCQFRSAAGNSICAQVLSLKQPSYFAVGQTYFEYISHFITNNIKNLCI